MLVRRPDPAEYPAVAELVLSAYDPFLAGNDDYRAMLEDTGRRDHEAEVYLAEEAGRMVGTVTLCPPGSPWREIADESASEGEFRLLAVDPAAHGRGYGSALTKWTCATLAEQGHRRVVLSSMTQMTTAHRMYESLGFTRAPDRDWRPVPHVDLYVYEREL